MQLNLPKKLIKNL